MTAKVRDEIKIFFYFNFSEQLLVCVFIFKQPASIKNIFYEMMLEKCYLVFNFYFLKKKFKNDKCSKNFLLQKKKTIHTIYN